MIFVLSPLGFWGRSRLNLNELEWGFDGDGAPQVGDFGEIDGVVGERMETVDLGGFRGAMAESGKYRLWMGFGKGNADGAKRTRKYSLEDAIRIFLSLA